MSIGGGDGGNGLIGSPRGLEIYDLQIKTGILKFCLDIANFTKKKKKKNTVTKDIEMPTFCSYFPPTF